MVGTVQYITPNKKVKNEQQQGSKGEIPKKKEILLPLARDFFQLFDRNWWASRSKIVEEGTEVQVLVSKTCQ